MREYVMRELDGGIAVRRQLQEQGVDAILAAGQVLVDCLRAGGKVLWCGNGGSAADCQHLSTELVGRFSGREHPGLASVALTTDTSVLTAVANDFGFEAVFRRQVEALGRPGDVLVAISTSGASASILAAAEEAGRIGMPCVALVGGRPTRLSELAAVTVAIPSEDTQRIQELHITVGHILCGIVEDTIHPPP